MFLLHNNFVPEDVVSEIWRRSDSPDITFEDIYKFLTDWVEQLFEVGDERDSLNHLLFGELDFLNFSNINVYPIHWRTLTLTDPDGEVKHVGFPLITVETF